MKTQFKAPKPLWHQRFGEETMTMLSSSVQVIRQGGAVYIY